MKMTKVKKQLDARIAAWERLKPEDKKACRRPGSLNKRS
mgnify:CR=1 FL=1